MEKYIKTTNGRNIKKENELNNTKPHPYKKLITVM